MTKKMTTMLLLSGLLVTAGVLVAEEASRSGVEWNAEAVKTMSKSERLAYQKQYKAAVEEAAKQSGVLPLTSKARQPEKRTAAQLNQVVGHGITYHSGALFAWPVNSVAVGNRFDTALTWKGDLGPVEMSGSVTMLTVEMAGVGGTGAFFSFYDQLAGTTANQITSRATPMVAGLNTITLPTVVSYVGSSYLAGVWNFSAAGDTVNVATGTVGGQGFHGMSINDGNPGNGFNALTMTNATVATQGSVLTPVELMSFSID